MKGYAPCLAVIIVGVALMLYAAAGFAARGSMIVSTPPPETRKAPLRIMHAARPVRVPVKAAQFGRLP
jgi:hypothetical protein